MEDNIEFVSVDRTMTSRVLQALDEYTNGFISYMKWSKNVILTGGALAIGLQDASDRVFIRTEGIQLIRDINICFYASSLYDADGQKALQTLLELTKAFLKSHSRSLLPNPTFILANLVNFWLFVVLM